MKLLSLTCSQCSGPLDIGRGASLVQCGYCGSRLRVEHDGPDLRAVPADDSAAAPLPLNGARELLDQLDLMDREWQYSREQFLASGRHGRQSIPTVLGSVVGMGVGGLFALFWTVSALRMGAPAIFPLFGLVFLGFILFGGVHSMKKASGYQQARADFEQRRRRILEQIQDR